MVNPSEVIAKNFSLSPAQYFETKVNYDLTDKHDFEKNQESFLKELSELNATSKNLENDILEMLKGLKYE